jgi:hypothetical protein
MKANDSAAIEPRNEGLQAGHFVRFERTLAHEAKSNLRGNRAKLSH